MLALAPTDWYMEPMRVDSGSLRGSWIQLTVVSEGSSRGHRVLGRVLVNTPAGGWGDRGRLQPDLAVAGVRPQEGEVDAGGVGCGRPLAHRLGPVLVVTQAEEATMVHEELRLGVEVDVGPVGHVQPEALEVEQQRQFVADESRPPPTPMSAGRAGRTTRPGRGRRSRTVPCRWARSRGCSCPRGCTPARW